MAKKIIYKVLSFLPIKSKDHKELKQWKFCLPPSPSPPQTLPPSLNVSVVDWVEFEFEGKNSPKKFPEHKPATDLYGFDFDHFKSPGHTSTVRLHTPPYTKPTHLSLFFSPTTALPFLTSFSIFLTKGGSYKLPASGLTPA